MFLSVVRRLSTVFRRRRGEVTIPRRQCVRAVFKTAPGTRPVTSPSQITEDGYQMTDSFALRHLTSELGCPGVDRTPDLRLRTPALLIR